MQEESRPVGNGIEQVVDVVCQVFEVRLEDLAVLQPTSPNVRNVSWARAACAMLARTGAGVSVRAMGRAIGFDRPVIHALDRRGRVWLRWAALHEPPPRQRHVTAFRRRFEKACLQLGVDVEDIAAEK